MGFVAKTALCYIPYVTGYITSVGPGPFCKPIILARTLRHMYAQVYIGTWAIWGTPMQAMVPTVSPSQKIKPTEETNSQLLPAGQGN